ncbi:MAG: VanZ family protein [Clostridia bacterium]|nr:VanZ family protein [Clostridia bacterium]
MLAAENGIESHERSDYVVQIVRQIIEYDISEVLVRKIAIIIEFGFLAFTIYLGMNYTNGISDKYSYASSKQKTIKHDNELFIMYSFWLSVLTAILVEYFQFFIEGRNPLVLDVCIAAGSICSILLIVRISFVIKLKLLKQEEIEY